MGLGGLGAARRLRRCRRLERTLLAARIAVDEVRARRVPGRAAVDRAGERLAGRLESGGEEMKIRTQNGLWGSVALAVFCALIAAGRAVSSGRVDGPQWPLFWLVLGSSLLFILWPVVRNFYEVWRLSRSYQSHQTSQAVGSTLHSRRTSSDISHLPAAQDQGAAVRPLAPPLRRLGWSRSGQS